MYVMRYFAVICVILVNMLKLYLAVGPDDPINLSFNMHQNDEDVSIYNIVFFYVSTIMEYKFVIEGELILRHYMPKTRKNIHYDFIYRLVEIVP